MSLTEQSKEIIETGEKLSERILELATAQTNFHKAKDARATLKSRIILEVAAMVDAEGKPKYKTESMRDSCVKLSLSGKEEHEIFCVRSEIVRELEAEVESLKVKVECLKAYLSSQEKLLEFTR